MIKKFISLFIIFVLCLGFLPARTEQVSAVEQIVTSRGFDDPCFDFVTELTGPFRVGTVDSALYRIRVENKPTFAIGECKGEYVKIQTYLDTLYPPIGQKIYQKATFEKYPKHCRQVATPEPYLHCIAPERDKPLDVYVRVSAGITPNTTLPFYVQLQARAVSVTSNPEVLYHSDPTPFNNVMTRIIEWNTTSVRTAR